MLSFIQLYHVGMAAMAPDAFISADEEGWSSLAAMSAGYDQLMPWMFAGQWGEGWPRRPARTWTKTATTQPR